MKKVLIIGGGYAGLSCAIQLARQEKFEITLVDARSYFLNLLQLHRTHFLKLERLQVDFETIARQWGVRFMQAEAVWEDSNPVPVALQLIGDPPGSNSISLDEYDFLVLTTGAQTSLREPGYDGAIALEDLQRKALQDYLEPLFERTDEPCIDIVGSGPTGIQYLFDIEGYLSRNKRRARLRMIAAEERLLAGFGKSFHRYASSRAKEKGIDILLNTRVQSVKNDEIRIQELKAGQSNAKATASKQPMQARPERTLQTDLCLWFPGVRPKPFKLETDAMGRLSGDRVFAAGDCSFYAGRGMNAMTAQSAVRKGKLVADNITALVEGQSMQSYRYQALGYFISLGSWDGIGWMLTRLNVLRGLSALVIKEAIEAQFKLYLEGIDTYIG